MGVELRKQPVDDEDAQQAEQPARHDRRLHADQRGHRGGLDVTEARTAGDDQDVNRGDPAAQRPPIVRLTGRARF